MGFRKRNARQDNKSKSAVIMGKPASELTKEEKKILSARMAEIRSENGGNSTVQNTIPFLCMYKDGVCQVSENFYSLTVQFYDANYSISEFDEQNYIFSKYCDIINLFDNTIKFQLTFENQNQGKADKNGADTRTGGRLQRYSTGIQQDADGQAVERQ